DSNTSLIISKSVDGEKVYEYNAAGLRSVDSLDEEIYLEASKSLIVSASNITAGDVTGFKFRYTWAAWPPEVEELSSIAYPFHERYPYPLPPGLRAVLERGYVLVRKETRVFAGIVLGEVSLTDIINVKPEEILVLEEVGGAQASVEWRIYREGAEAPDMRFSATHLPAYAQPMKLWLPAKEELRVTLYAAAATAYAGRIKVKRVKPRPEVAKVMNV
ncbi:MAG: hypothetical protein QXM02_07835, partial [Thermoproteota archaeon]